MPKVDNQHQAGAGAIVPHFVLEAIVEDEPFAVLPKSRLLRNAYGRAARHLQSQMCPYSAVGWSAVWPHVRSRMHHAELYLASLTATGRRELFYQATREGRFGTVLVYPVAPEEQLELLPISGVTKVLGLVFEVSG